LQAGDVTVRDFVLVTGMVLETGPVNDYDRRLVILTKERGKITVFAKGARRPNSRMMAGTNPFSFGTFKLYEGRTAYNMIDMEIDYYFEELRTDFEGAYLGMYFLEYASYYTRENNDEMEMLKLLFQTVRAIIKPTISNRLVRVIYEIKAMAVNGEFPGVPKDRTFSEAAVFTVNFIVKTPVEHLYTFAVTDQVLTELQELSDIYRKRYIDRTFKSLEMVETCFYTTE